MFNDEDPTDATVGVDSGDILAIKRKLSVEEDLEPCDVESVLFGYHMRPNEDLTRRRWYAQR